MDSEWLNTQFRLHPDKSKAALAKALGLDAPAISKMLAGTRQIKAAEYVGMRRYFGLPVDGEKAAGMIAGGADAYVLSPLQGLHESGAPQERWVIPAHLIEQRIKAQPDQIKIFTVQESAMIPELLPGETVLVNLADKVPSPPGMFIVSDGLGPIIRQCEYVPHSSPAQISLSVLNGKAAPRTVKLAESGIIGRVIAKLQWL